MSVLATLLVRFLGVWLIVAQAAAALPYATILIFGDHDYAGSLAERIGEASLSLLPAVIGLVLIVSARSLADRLMAGLTDEGRVAEAPDRRALERFGTFLLGLYIVAYALPVIAVPLVQFASIAATDHTATFGAVLTEDRPEFGWAIGELILGLALILVSRRS